MSIGADLIRGHTDAIILAQLLKRTATDMRSTRPFPGPSEGEYELKEATLIPPSA